MLGEEQEEADQNEAEQNEAGAACDNETVIPEPEDAIEIDGRRYLKSEQFVNKPAWKRFIIIAAGPVFNIVLAFLLSLVITGAAGFDKPVVIDAEAGMPAAEAGIEAGDILYGMSVNGDRAGIESSRDIRLFTFLHKQDAEDGQEFTVLYRDASDGMKKKAAVIVPRYSEDTDSRRLGFAYSSAYAKTDGPADTVLCSVFNVKYCLRTVAASFKMLFGGRVSRQDVMGPIRMVAVMDESVEEASGYGIGAAALTLFDLMILISVSLGAMNLLPLPALDGGRILFILIELLTRRAVPKELEARIHMIGMLLLLALMVFIMTNDISLLVFG